MAERACDPPALPRHQCQRIGRARREAQVRVEPPRAGFQRLLVAAPELAWLDRERRAAVHPVRRCEPTREQLRHLAATAGLESVDRKRRAVRDERYAAAVTVLAASVISSV